jgi:omega-6 fatty acid desaturase (delta-12 desaturase)
MLGVAVGMSLVFGIIGYVLIQSTILLVAGSAGVWLFYVQHQFEGVYWRRHEQWHYVEAALQGSSFYKLPKILQWFSGNIGYHHIHHLSARIPNYNLERCHKAEPLFQAVPEVTLRASLKSLTLRLWDEEHHKLVGFGQIGKRLAGQAAALKRAGARRQGTSRNQYENVGSVPRRSRKRA